MSRISGILTVSDDFAEVNPVPWIRGSLDSYLFYESRKGKDIIHSNKRILKGLLKRRIERKGKTSLIHSNKRIPKGL